MLNNVMKSWLSIAMNLTFLSWIFLGDPNISNFYFMLNVLGAYCLLDMKTSKDMVIHHLAVLGINFALNSFPPFDHEPAKVINEFLSYYKVFFKTEVSTVFLCFIHLKYKNPVVYGLFVSTFIYFRNYCLTKTFLDWEVNNFTEKYCNNSFCVYVWYISFVTLIVLNWYWLIFILNKLKKKITKKNK